MSLNLMIVASIFILAIIILILYFLRKNKLKVKYAIIWLLLFGFLLIFLLIPGLLGWITNLLGFQMSSNMIISLLLGVLVIISISLTGIVSSQDKKIRLLVQEISIIKSGLNGRNNNE